MSAGSSLPDPEYLPRTSLVEREAHGRSHRDVVPLERHAEWTPAPDRADPVDVLTAQAGERVPELIPIRHGRMAASAFAFYRGGAAIMAADLACTPTTDLRSQLCGDAHLCNFGIFETPERHLVFGLNDFDETLPGPIDWDVKRLAASIEIAGRDLALSSGDRHKAVVATVRSYREAMLGFAGDRNVDVWYTHLPAEDLASRLRELGGRKAGDEAERRIRQALRRDHMRAFDRLVDGEADAARFASRPPVLVPIEDLLDSEARARYVDVIRGFLRQYRESLPADRRVLVEQYRFVHMARKVVGVGSVGTRAWIVLLVGRDDHDPLVLQLKEAQQSVLAPYAGRVPYDNQGRRVVEGQRLMQTASDHLLGYYRLQALDGRMHDFYVRQLWDGKASIEVANLTAKGLRVYGEACGWTLARGHARSGDRVAIAAYLGEDTAFDEALATFASSYADTNAEDHSRLLSAIEDGRLEAVTGV